MASSELNPARRSVSRRFFLRGAALGAGGLALLTACGPQGGASGPAQSPPAAGAATPAGAAAQTQPGATPAAATAGGASAAASTGATSAPATIAGTPVAASSAGAPKSGGVMRVGLGLDVATMDPHLSGSKLDRQVYHNVFDPLLTLDEKLAIQPNLVESWQNPDPQTLVLKLRAGLTFHDGTDLNADAVKFNFDRMATDPKSVRKAEIATVGSTDVVDPLTVRLNLTQPDSTLLATLTDRAGMMISPTAFNKLGQDFANNPVGAGNGPFEFVEWVKDDHLLLKRHAGYWGAGPSSGPYLDQVRYRPIPDDTVKQQSLQAGEIDALDYLAPRNVAEAKTDPSLVVVDVPSLAAFWLTLNQTKPPFDNTALRQAALYAIDIDAIVKAVWLSVGVPANGPISPSSWAYDSTIKPIARDLDKAKAKLAEGGMPGGYTFTYNAEQTPLEIQFSEVLKAQLADAGITMNVQVVDSARYLAEGNGRISQASLYSWSGRPDPDGNVYPFFHSTSGASLNWSGISNPQVDQLLEQTRQISDHDQRKQLYSQVTQILLDQAPVVFLIHPIEPKAFSPKVQGYPAIPDGMMRFKNVWLSTA